MAGEEKATNRLPARARAAIVGKRGEGIIANDHILAIDQGTTSTRSIVFDARGHAVASAQVDHIQHYPGRDRVEHDAMEIWKNVLDTARQAIAASGLGAQDIAAIGIANQRETSVVWDRDTGEPIHNAIVWQDRRSAQACAKLVEDGHGAEVTTRTGLLIHPYFSATKIAWILDQVPGARDRAERGALCAGTMDSFMLWHLTGGRVHMTDITNASRTMLFDIHRQCWDARLCALFRIPMAILPEVHDNDHAFGRTAPGLFERPIPITGMAGDQQAALIGQTCFEVGSVKATYGTGCFMLLHTGDRPVTSGNRLLTTPAYRIKGRTAYAIEGSIFAAGAAVKWLRDGVGLIERAGDTQALAQSVPDTHGVYMVPAFAGLGAPHWDAGARGAIYGLTLDTRAAHLARASLEAVAYQTLDLITAMRDDGGAMPRVLRIDGGMAANDWLCQFIADVADVPVDRPDDLETTALGAAFLAGLGAGLWPDLDSLAKLRRRERAFQPNMKPDMRAARIDGWHDAVTRTRSRQAGA